MSIEAQENQRRAQSLYAAFRTGWLDGACMKPENMGFMNHSDVKLKNAYEEGFSQGKASRNLAFGWAKKIYNYEPISVSVQDKVEIRDEVDVSTKKGK